MKRIYRFPAILLLTVIMSIVLAACSSGFSGEFASQDDARSVAQEAAPAAPAASGIFPGFPGSSGDRAPRPPAAPAPAVAAPVPAPAAPAAPAPAFGADGGAAKAESEERGVLSGTGSTDADIALLSQERIIVRTVDMDIEVPDIAETIDEIADLAQSSGGWVVSSDRSAKHRGFISIRVPAAQLDGSIQALRNLATDVRAEVTNSRDVTDEFVDLRARLENQQSTEGALLRLMDRAETVEDTLNVQRELTRVQEEIERLSGRIKLLQETAAFSLINVSLRLTPADMPVDAGLDKTVSVGQFARFRATFLPPEGIEDFSFEWDFGDGSEPLFSNRTAPSIDGDGRITTTVTHPYNDDRDSPFIVEIMMTGTGDAGLAEGEDTLIVTVTKIPSIEVFAGEGFSTREGDEAEFEGSFTRPEGLRDMNFEWDFGDGTAPATGNVESGVTRVEVVHTYADRRPGPYTATLTVKATSDAGEIESDDSISVFVSESRGWVVSGWDLGDTGKSGVRALSAVVQVLISIAIVLAIFSPLWIIIGGGLFLLIRRYRRRRRSADPSS